MWGRRSRFSDPRRAICRYDRRSGPRGNVGSVRQDPDKKNEQDVSALPDDGQLELLIREQHGRVVAFLQKRGLSATDAEDVAQESALRLMRYRSQPLASLKVLFYRIALNAMNDTQRRRTSSHAVRHQSLDETAFELASDSDAEQWASRQQELAKVRAALLRLPPRCRRIYLLNRIEGMSYTQIATHCGISVKAVEKQISKALVLLRAALADPHRGPGA